MHDLPVTTTRAKSTKDHAFECPLRGRLWVLPFQLKNKPHETYVFLSVSMHPCIYKLHEKYGHAPLDKLKRMAIVGELDGEDKRTRTEVNVAKGRIDCHDCDAGKNAKK